MKLQLFAKANNWEFFSARKANPKFGAARKKILARDKYTCYYCHFRSDELEIINVDHDYEHNKPANLKAACALCARCVLLDSYPLSYEGGDKMVYMPEMTQETLNHTCRHLFCKVDDADDSEGAYNAKMILAQMQDRAAWLDEKAGCALSHPAMFLHYMGMKDHDKKLVHRVRWLPTQETFSDHIPHWRELLKDSAGV
jgi:intracellular multiplication protein IcmJ